MFRRSLQTPPLVLSLQQNYCLKVLAPTPGTGSASQLRAFYVPKGMVLWCSLLLAGPANSSETPIIAAQGGFY